MTKKLLALFLALAICAPIFAMDDDLDGFDWDEFSTEADMSGSCFDSISDERTCGIPAKTILTDIAFLGLPPAIIDALKLTAYLETQPPTTRFISDQPIFIKWNTGKSFFSVDLFLNLMDKAYFTKDSPHIKSYLALEEENTLRVASQFGREFNLDLPQVLRLFEDLKMREAKLGFMFQARKQFPNGMYAGLQVPVYYFIRHYHATEQELNEIKNNNIFGSSSEPSESNSFIQDHFVGDALGIGDLRFSFAYKAWEQDTYSITLGTQVTVPSAFYTRGLYGANFTKIDEPAFIDLENFLCGYVEYEKTRNESLGASLDQQKKDFGIRILDWLSANLLVPPMGNEKRWVWGLFVEPHLNIQEKISVKTRFAFDYLFGNSGKRFLLAERNFDNLNTYIFDINNSEGEITEEEASNRFSYMSELIQEKFGPNRTQVDLSGRAQVQLTIAPEFRFTDNWTVLLGYDFWWLQAEYINNCDYTYTNRYALTAPVEPEYIVTQVGEFPAPPNIEKANRPAAYQNKLFASANYKRFTKKHDLTFSLAGDITIGNAGIGKDFTLLANLSWNF